MQMKQWGIRLALGFVFCLGALGCHLTDTFLAQATVAPTRTKTVKPTFTVIPSLTATPIPPTLTPTKVPSATLRPTLRPATKPPPTKPPVVAPAPPSGPTASPYEWHVNAPGCEHSGGTYIKARVYGDKNNPDSGMEGMRVALGGPDGIGIWDKVTTTWDGTYTFVLSPDGAPGRVGTWYVWLVDASDKRISDIGGPIKTNGLGPDAGGCWHGWVDFWR
jgi:hypothetical protein